MALQNRYQNLPKNIDHLPLELRRDGQQVFLPAQTLLHQLQVRDMAYIPVPWIHPLQSVVSYYGVGINLFLKAGKKMAFPPLKFSQNLATQKLESAKEAVLGPKGKVYLLDGHHTFTASLLSGSSVFPIKVKKIYNPNLSEENFIQAVLQDNYAYLTDLLTGKTVKELKKDFSELEDSAFRGWIDASGAEITESEQVEREIRSETSTPAWIRDGNQQPPFAEFLVARILVEEGLNQETCPQCFLPAPRLTEEVNEKIREYLIKAKNNHRFDQLPGIYVLEEKVELTELNVQKALASSPEYNGVNINHRVSSVITYSPDLTVD